MSSWQMATAAALICLGSSSLTTADDDASPRDNVVVILDASGSMNGTMSGSRQTRMEVAKQALTQLISHVPDDTNVGLLVFSGTNVSNEWMHPLGAFDRQQFASAVQQLQPGGGTPLGAYLKKGADALLAQRELQQGYGTFRLLVVSDGEADDKELVELYLPEVISRGLTLDVIGVDMKSDLSLATRVHKYRRANNPTDLQQALQKAFAEVGADPNDALDEKSFDLLAGLPDELAVAMLGALASPANHPIGTAAGSPGGGLAESAPLPNGSGTSPLPASTTPEPSDGFNPTWVIVLAVLLIAVRFLFRSKRVRR